MDPHMAAAVDLKTQNARMVAVIDQEIVRAEADHAPLERIEWLQGVRAVLRPTDA